MNIILAWLWTIWRWSRALYVFGWRALYDHYRLLRVPHACNACHRQTLPLEAFWDCTQCLEYNLCDSCCGDARHPHEMVREVLPLVVASCHYTTPISTAEALDASLLLFHTRRCIGAREEGNSSGSYKWTSYADVRIAAHAIGHQLASFTSTPGDFAALLCAVTTEWVLSDLACILKGVPLVLLHRSTTVQQLCHVLSSVRVTVIVASQHVKASLFQSLTDTPHHTVRDVIWVDDSEDSYNNAGGCVAEPSITSHVWGDVMTAGRVDSSFRVASISPDAIVKLLPSSGTTGTLPKLTVVTERMARPSVVDGTVKASRSEDACTVLYVYEVSLTPSSEVPRSVSSPVPYIA